MTQSYADAIDLYDQDYALQVEALHIAQLDITFQIKRSLSAKVANSAEIKIYNLSPDSRQKLQAMRDVFVSLEAGYAGGRSLIFRGELREAWSARDGNDWVTSIGAGDAEKPRKKARVNKSFPAGTSASTVITHCAQALQVGLGNVTKQAALAKLWNVSPSVFSCGYVASGDALSQLDRICRSCGMEWSIQDNQLQLLERGKPLQETGIVLTESSGLVGSPELGKGGVVRCRTLMIPGLYPGRRVELKSRALSGVYRVETTHHRGVFGTEDWGCEAEFKLPKGALADAANAGKKSYGALVPGNIDLTRRPYVRNADGTISTVRSISIERDGKIYLLPTVSDEGLILGNAQAVAYFVRTRRHLGIYRTEADAERAADAIHEDQEAHPPVNILDNGLGPADLL
jgi:hypothetical protein